MMSADSTVELRKFVAPEFVFGSGALTLVGRYVRNFGARKALAVTDPRKVSVQEIEALYEKAL